MTGMEIVGPSVQRISTTLPSFLFALGILVVGYVIAKVAAGLVSRALGRTNLDARTAEALGLTKPGAPATVRSVVARIAFWLIMLFVLIGFFNQIGLTLVAEPLRGVADAIARVAPSLLHASLIFVAAWILAGLLRWLVVKTLTRLDVERRFGHFFVPEGTDPRGLSQTMGNLTFYLVLLLAVPPSSPPWDRALSWPRSPRCCASCFLISPTWLRRP
jgi:Mechanosensitive ion channel, conserved TM helix